MNREEYIKELRKAKDKKDYKRYWDAFQGFILLLILCGIGIGLLGMFLAVFA